MMKPISKILVLMFLSSHLAFCQSGMSKQDIEFDYLSFIEDEPLDSVNIFIADILSGDTLKSHFYEIPDIDVGPLLKDANGEKYLGYLGKYILPYTSNPDSLLPLGFYFKKKYNLKNSIYDQMLKGCVLLDEHYNRAIYLLAELRFKKGGYAEDAYFLMSLLRERLPKNKEVKRIYEYFQKRQQGKPLKPDNLREYLLKDYYYSIED